MKQYDICVFVNPTFIKIVSNIYITLEYDNTKRCVQCKKRKLDGLWYFFLVSNYVLANNTKHKIIAS